MTHLETLLALATVALAAAGALQLMRERKPYEAKKLMSPIEQEAYRRLRAALPHKEIYPQVQLCRFIERKKGLDKKWHRRIAQLSVDFVVCELDSSVTAVIEIDGRTHERDVQQRRDRKKDRACESAGIRIIRWQARRLPAVEEMRKQLGPGTGCGESQTEASAHSSKS